MSRLLDVNSLGVDFPAPGAPLKAVRGIDFHVDAGEVVAIVGESGSGKSTAAMAVVGLLPEYADVRGSVRLQGTELVGLRDDAMSRLRGNNIGTVFQDPMSALTPVYTVGDQIAEAIEVHQPQTAKKAGRQRAIELLELVGIVAPEKRARAFPHELSGGERQRVVIAIAIANDPDLLICDEPTTALDVTVQKQVLRLMRHLQASHHTAIVFVTHDIGVVAQICDRVTLLFEGRVVESGTTAEILAAPKQPYTKALIAAGPRYDRPEIGLQPVPDSIINTLRADIIASDGRSSNG
jgi:ABC-type dipeptide/oligopeptide/nickel transport system ATPase component